jgi:hypothetical protein
MVLLASDFDKSKYWKAADLEAEKKLRIKSVTQEQVGEQKELKLVVWFTNDERGLVLNKTNNRTLRKEFGDDCSGWSGKIVVLFRTMDEFRGKPVPVLRVRIPPPKQATAGNGQGRAMPMPKPQPLKPTAVAQLDDFADENEPPAKPAAKSSPTDDLDDEIPW